MDGILYVVKTGCQWRMLTMDVGKRFTATLTLGASKEFGSQ
ncbi:transposase [Zooshikella ganghwensis]|uniref:Transposase n=1 Tax=Zooshikella ganghwensis TaxID=202772 RepID=A0A4V1IPB7_9GAMM|nr:transposase [Zooshikella ganghwensis]